MVAVAAGRDAAHVDGGEAGLRGLEGYRRQLLGIFLEVRDVQLVELLGPEHLHADRNVLHALFALGRGDDDLILIGTCAATAGAVSSRVRAGGCPVVCGSRWFGPAPGLASAVEASSAIAGRAEGAIRSFGRPHSRCDEHCGRAARACQRQVVTNA